MTDLHYAGIEALAQLVRDKEVSPSEVMEHTLSRVEALNPSLNAIVALDADAARAAAAEQTERIANGDDLGPLGGVPFAVKDLENLAGFRTTGGSRVYRDVPPWRRSVTYSVLPSGVPTMPLGVLYFSRRTIVLPSGLM